VSSDYSIFCLSHDPAIEVIAGAGSRDETVAQAVAGLDSHPICDLLVARYSGAIMEVGCPGAAGPWPTNSRHRGHAGWHRDTIWADANLLRVAVAVELAGPESGNALTAALQRATRFCWTPDRLRRLRVVLDVQG
jgi:hypothetical protein